MEAESAPTPEVSREAFAEQLRQLESFIASASAEGEQLPPEAVEMVARLREVVLALDGLTSSLEP
jgi:hypothetical protein